MKIAFIVNEFPALSETFILRQIVGLLEAGHDVDIFAYGPRNDSTTHRDIETYALLRRTYYLTACAGSRPVPARFMIRLGCVVANFHKHPSVVCRTLNIAKFGKGALLLQVLCQIAPFLGKGPYDIVHCQFGNLGRLGLLLKDAGIFSGKLVTSFRGYDISSYVKSHGAEIYADLFMRGDLFLCVSDHIKENLIRLGCEGRKIVVHRSGVDIDKSTPLRAAPNRYGNVRILTVARLTEKKGIEYGIRAVSQVLRQGRRIEYTVAGDGPLKTELHRLIAELRVGDSVKLVGWKSQHEIAEMFKNSDILLVPSVRTESGEEEGIPGVIMEGFAQGLPVVSTRHAGIPEVVQDSQSGFLVAERDVDALAQKVQLLADRPALGQAMGQRGRDFVDVHYNIEKLNRRLVSLYKQLLNDSIEIGTEAVATLC